MSEARAPKYVVEVTKAAVRKKIDALANDPRPHGFKKLKGNDGLYRIRVGNFRIIYEIHEGRLLVLIVRVGDRKDVYWDT